MSSQEHRILTLEEQNQVEPILREAGWFPERQVDITNVLREMEEAGLYVSPKVEAFLREFTDLEIKFQPRYWPRPDEIFFGLLVPPDDFYELKIWGDKLGHTFYSVGHHDIADTTLLMDEDARLYELADDALAKIGDSAMDGINAMILQWRVIEDYGHLQDEDYEGY